MVSTRFACILLLLISTVWYSIALPHQGVNAAALIGKDPLNGIFAVTATAASYRRLRGRKMVADKPEKVKENVTNGGSSSNMDSNAKHINGGKCEVKGKGGLNLKSKQSGKKLQSDEMYGVGFVGLNSDYPAPRHHPPKNN